MTLDEPAHRNPELLLRRLIRLLCMRPNANLPPGLRQRAVMWAYEDCITEGLKAKADIALTSVLGPPASRATPVGTKLVFLPKLAEPNPNTCICGHPGKQHHFAQIGFSAGCNTAGCACRGFVSELDGPPVKYVAPPLDDDGGEYGNFAD